MADSFNTFMTGIESGFWRDLCMNEGRLMHYERGDEFLHVGEVSKHIGYIKSGTLKYIAYSNDGTEHVVGLEFAGEFVADFPQCLYDMKSRVSIVAVKPADVYCFPAEELAARMKSDERLKDMVMRSTEAIFSMVYDRYVALYCQTPQERYDDLITNHPDMFSMFSLKDIASYLDITPTHLSRLRKNVK